MKHKDTLARLAALHGIASEYQDISGNPCHTGEATQRALLSAMGVKLEGDLSVAEQLVRIEASRDAGLLTSRFSGRAAHAAERER